MSAWPNVRCLMTSRSYRAHVGICPTCGKQSWLTRADARKAGRKLPGGHMNAYRCETGYWHTGHLADDVVRGEKDRSIYR